MSKKYTSTIAWKLNKQEPISLPYFRLVLSFINKDFINEIENAKSNMLSDKDKKELKMAYKEFVKKLEKNIKKGKIGMNEKSKVIRWKRSEFKKAMKVLEKGIRLEDKTFRKLKSLN